MASLNLNHHRLTARERLVQDSREAARAQQRYVLGNELALFSVVAEGKQQWRIAFTRNMREHGLLISNDICDQMFEVFCAEVRLRWNTEQTEQAVAKAALDCLEPEPAPLTDEQIIDDLEVDSASSDDGRRALYGDYSPEQELAKLKDQAKREIKH